MFSERQTTHFFGVNSSRSVSFAKDADGCLWAKCSNGSTPFSINLGKNPKAIGCAMPTHAVRAIKIALKSGHTPVVGQQYTANIRIPQYADYSECPLNMTASAMALSTTANDLYVAMAKSIYEQNYAFKKHTSQSVVRVYLEVTDTTTADSTTTTSKRELSFSGGTWTNTTLPTPSSGHTNEFTGIIIAEDYQHWQWGIFEQKTIILDKDDVRLAPISTTTNSNFIAWADVTDYTTTFSESLILTRRLADMEYQHVMNRLDATFAQRREFVSYMDNECVINDLVSSSDNPSSDTQCNLIRIRGTYRGEDGHDVQENFFELIIAGAAASVVVNGSTAGGLAKAFVDALGETYSSGASPSYKYESTAVVE